MGLSAFNRAREENERKRKEAKLQQEKDFAVETKKANQISEKIMSEETIAEPIITPKAKKANAK